MLSATILHSHDKKWHWTVSGGKSPNKVPAVVLSRLLKRGAKSSLEMEVAMLRKASLALVEGISTSRSNETKGATHHVTG